MELISPKTLQGFSPYIHPSLGRDEGLDRAIIHISHILEQTCLHVHRDLPLSLQRGRFHPFNANPL